MSHLTKGQGIREGDIEFVRTFGLLAFGAAAAEWDDEIFFYRTGIALKLHELKCSSRMTNSII